MDCTNTCQVSTWGVENRYGLKILTASLKQRIPGFSSVIQKMLGAVSPVPRVVSPKQTDSRHPPRGYFRPGWKLAHHNLISAVGWCKNSQGRNICRENQMIFGPGRNSNPMRLLTVVHQQGLPARRMIRPWKACLPG